MLESAYQTKLITKINRDLREAIVIKNDANYLPGIPDLSILFFSSWGMLEVKTSKDAPERPNQAYYVGLFDSMSFAAFIYPENEEEVLGELYRSLTTGGPARLP